MDEAEAEERRKAMAEEQAAQMKRIEEEATKQSALRGICVQPIIIMFTPFVNCRRSCSLCNPKTLEGVQKKKECSNSSAKMVEKIIAKDT